MKDVHPGYLQNRPEIDILHENHLATPMRRQRSTTLSPWTGTNPGAMLHELQATGEELWSTVLLDALLTSTCS